jgi:hypothetical protein
MLVVVQQITISWTKAERNAANATERNALPRCLPLLPTTGAAVYLCQRYWHNVAWLREFDDVVFTGSLPATVVHLEVDLF